MRSVGHEERRVQDKRTNCQGCNPGGINGLGRTNRETYLLMQYCVACNIKRGVAHRYRDN